MLGINIIPIKYKPNPKKILVIFGNCHFQEIQRNIIQYQEINNKLDGPKFDVHLTISGPINYDDEIQIEILEDVSCKFGKIDLQLKSLNQTDEFFRREKPGSLFSKGCGGHHRYRANSFWPVPQIWCIEELLHGRSH